MIPANDFREMLAPHVWTHPESYAGFSPEGDYVLAAQHRDSDTLTRSNWLVFTRDFHPEEFDGRSNDFASRPAVYTWSASHCMVGWVDYMCIRADAPESVLASAAESLAALSDYPILDESHFCDLEYTEACEYWERMSVRERASYCAESDISIFAARRDYLPEDPNGTLLERLRGN